MHAAGVAKSLLALMLGAGCAAEPTVPPGVPPLAAAPAACVELGERLFFDPRLSDDGDTSCATCHRPELAFTDGQATPVGTFGDPLERGTPSLANVGYQERLTWANPHLAELEDHALVPLFGDDPVELGAAGRAPEILDALRSDRRYARLAAACGSEVEGAPDALDWRLVRTSLAAYQRTLVSFGSAFDAWLEGDESALPRDALRGWELAQTPELGCVRCHGRDLFAARDGRLPPARSPLFVRAYRRDGVEHEGLAEFTHESADYGRLRPPSLRNLPQTAPYFHDGAASDLDQALELHVERTRTDDERAALLAWLRALDDPDFSRRAARSSPRP